MRDGWKALQKLLKRIVIFQGFQERGWAIFDLRAGGRGSGLFRAAIKFSAERLLSRWRKRFCR